MPTQVKPWVTTPQHIDNLCILDCEQRMNKLLEALPEWGEMPKRPGLYLSLSHGRDFPQQAMKGRGFPGPKLGPLLYVKTHYGQQVTLRFQNRRDARRFFPDTTISINSLEVIEGTLVYDKKCYGDWDICYIAAEFCLKDPDS